MCISVLLHLALIKVLEIEINTNNSSDNITNKNKNNICSKNMNNINNKNKNNIKIKKRIIFLNG